MDPLTLLENLYPPGSKAHRILLDHSLRVAEKSIATAQSLAASAPIDMGFVEEAALLHDIGIRRTAAPAIGCHGDLPYLCHGYEGRKILEEHGMPRHALVCERHIGVGLTAREIRGRKLPLPVRDMIPITLEEQIVTYADLFFSKNPGNGAERSIDEVRGSILRFGRDQLAIFDNWHLRFTRA